MLRKKIAFWDFNTHAQWSWPWASAEKGLGFWMGRDQEIIKVRERIPHIGPLTEVIPLKLFLDTVPSSFSDITRALRGCFRGGSVYLSFVSF